MSRFIFWIFAPLAGLVGLPLSASAATATVALGQSASFSVAAAGTPPFTYQWLKNNAPISGAVGSKYMIAAVATVDAGTYTATVTNSAGSITSDAAVLMVNAASASSGSPPPAVQPGHLSNLSVRAVAGSGSQTLIVGFIVSGTTNLPILMRGWGPELAADPFNVSGTLADPLLRIFRDSALIAENDNWGGAAAIASLASQVGAYPFPPASKDAAISASVAPGSNTAHLIGPTGATGVVLAELFDASSASGAASTRLTNVSARAQVGTGSNVLIGGFVIGGQTPLTVLIRAIGPTLANYGVDGVLADPILELHSSTALLQSNDNWSDAPNAAAISTMNSTRAFALPAQSKDAVILVTLAPGLYSAVVKGVNNSTGAALLEVYEAQ